MKMEGNKKYLQGRFCPVGGTGCLFCGKDPVLTGHDLYCNNPAMNGEPLSSVPYCAFEKYQEVSGKWVWIEDLKKYIDHIVMRLETIKVCEELGILPNVNSSKLEYERQELHDRIMKDAHEQRGSEWEKALKQYVEEKASETMKKMEDN